MTIIEAIESPALFRPFFKDLRTWENWLVYLRTLFGLPVESPSDRKLIFECTGLKNPPKDVRESYVIAGRRSGKSYISSVIAVFLACFKDWTPYLSPGERGMIFILAVDRDQAAIIKRYVSGLIHSNPILAGMIENETRDEINLKNRVTIAIKTCSFRSVRGFTVLCAILEEIAFWRSEDSANPDREVLAALRPALATVPNSLLIAISTPYSKSGVLYDQFKRNFGQSGKALVWKASSRLMNPTLDQELIESALRDDLAAARAEWEAEWREDIQSFLSSELVEAVIIPGRFELSRLAGVQYHGFVDPSGGRADSFTLAIVHTEKSGKIILDVLRERHPPFQPKSVVAEFSDLLKAFKISEVGSDRYAGAWVSSAFQEHGIAVKNSENSASDLYLELLPLISNGSVELLDSKRLISQLVGLERRIRSGGRDLITHFPGSHDDLSNAVAGACVAALEIGREGSFIGVTKSDLYGDGDNDRPRSILSRDDIDRY
ncbi:MAG: hypothetical protein Q8O01_02855, partial [Candidatus Omnitrophota bacterium]|nr:hypothetical protein [Candidatus Omnitrophota bacterium]